MEGDELITRCSLHSVARGRLGRSRAFFYISYFDILLRMRKRKIHRLPLKKLRELERESKIVEPDLKYWLHHVLHWHALLLATCAILALGYYSGS